MVDKFKIWKRNSTSNYKADYAYALDRFRLAIQTEKADWYNNRINIADNRPRIKWCRTSFFKTLCSCIKDGLFHTWPAFIKWQKLNIMINLGSNPFYWILYWRHETGNTKEQHVCVYGWHLNCHQMHKLWKSRSGHICHSKLFCPIFGRK